MKKFIILATVAMMAVSSAMAQSLFDPAQAKKSHDGEKKATTAVCAKKVATCKTVCPVDTCVKAEAVCAQKECVDGVCTAAICGNPACDGKTCVNESCTNANCPRTNCVEKKDCKHASKHHCTNAAVGTKKVSKAEKQTVAKAQKEVQGETKAVSSKKKIVKKK